jgi:hypothetical protein
MRQPFLFWIDQSGLRCGIGVGIEGWLRGRRKTLGLEGNFGQLFRGLKA